MNTKTLAKLLLASGTVLALSTPFLLVRADNAKVKPKSDLKIEIEGDRGADGGLSNFEENLKRFFQGFGGNLNDDQKKELDQALEKFRGQLKEPSKPGDPQSFKFQWRSDGSTPQAAKETPKETAENLEKPRRRGKVEVDPDAEEANPPRRTPDAAENLREQLRKHFEDFDFDRFFGDDFFGPFMRDFGGRRQGQEADPFKGLMDRRNPSDKRTAKYEKGARRALAEFRPVVQEARPSVAIVYRGGDKVALATILTADGYAISKASMLGNGDKLECEFSDGESATAKVVDKLKDYDLALLKIDAKDLKPIQWNVEDNVPGGTLLAAVGPEEDPIAIGVVSVPARNLLSAQKGYLGIGPEGAEDGVSVGKVNEKSPAEKAGLQVGDVITAIDGKPMRSPRELTDYVTSKRPEEDVHVSYRRGKEDRTAVVTLASRDEIILGSVGGRDLNESEFRRLMRQGDLTARMGGQGNNVADGFPKALQNDLFINVDECGGPIVGIDGRALGINIARAERTKTFAIPASTLKDLLSQVSEGKFHLPKDPSNLKREARLAGEAVQELEKKLNEAKEKEKAAREAFQSPQN